MRHDLDRWIEYSGAERAALVLLGFVGLVGVNGAFVYGLVEPDLLREAMRNPVSIAFMAEAMVLMLFFAYLLAKWGVARLGPAWFIALSLIGSMAFALPVVLLWPRSGKSEPAAT